MFTMTTIMDSPPRPFIRPTSPTTPSKPLRSRPRVPNRSSTKTHLNCKRCLFGRPNRGDVTVWLDKELQTVKLEQQRRWNFDFSTMTPLAGGNWKWEQVSALPNAVATIAVKNPSSFPPKSPLEAQRASFTLPDVPPFGATRPPSTSSDAYDDDDVAFGFSDDGDDVFDVETTEGGRPAKRARMTTSNDENSNPIFDAAPLFSPRLSSPFGGRGSVERSFSESSESTDENAAPEATALSTSATSMIVSPSKMLSPLLYREPSTPSRSTRGELTSPPPRITRALSRKRDASSTTSSKGGVSQTRLQEFFPVKRRSLEISGANASAVKVGKLRKKIDFDA